MHVDVATATGFGAQLAAARPALAAVSVAGYDPVSDADGSRLAAALRELARGLG